MEPLEVLLIHLVPYCLLPPRRCGESLEGPCETGGGAGGLSDVWSLSRAWRGALHVGGQEGAIPAEGQWVAGLEAAGGWVQDTKGRGSGGGLV